MDPREWPPQEFQARAWEKLETIEGALAEGRKEIETHTRILSEHWLWIKVCLYVLAGLLGGGGIITAVASMMAKVAVAK